MERVALAPDLEISRIAYGMWRLAEDPDIPALVTKIEACLDQGITTMDQADIYGDYESEGVFGQALRYAPHLRERMELVTKCGIVLPSEKFPDHRVKHYDTSAAHVTGSVENSLRKMNTDRIDLLLLHRPDPFMDAEETARALDTLVQQGKVRHLGVSNYRPHDWSYLQSALSTPLVTNQIELSLVAFDAFRNGDLAFLQERKVAPMAWSPLGGGTLFAAGNTVLNSHVRRIANEQNVTEAAVALAWLLAHPAKIVPVMGSNRLERIQNFSEALGVAMDRQTWFDLYASAIGHEVP